MSDPLLASGVLHLCCDLLREAEHRPAKSGLFHMFGRLYRFRGGAMLDLPNLNEYLALATHSTPTAFMQTLLRSMPHHLPDFRDPLWRSVVFQSADELLKRFDNVPSSEDLEHSPLSLKCVRSIAQSKKLIQGMSKMQFTLVLELQDEEAQPESLLVRPVADSQDAGNIIALTVEELQWLMPSSTATIVVKVSTEHQRTLVQQTGIDNIKTVLSLSEVASDGTYIVVLPNAACHSSITLQLGLLLSDFAEKKLYFAHLDCFHGGTRKTILVDQKGGAVVSPVPAPLAGFVTQAVKVSTKVPLAHPLPNYGCSVFIVQAAFAAKLFSLEGFNKGSPFLRSIMGLVAADGHYGVVPCNESVVVPASLSAHVDSAAAELMLRYIDDGKVDHVEWKMFLQGDARKAKVLLEVLFKPLGRLASESNLLVGSNIDDFFSQHVEVPIPCGT